MSMGPPVELEADPVPRRSSHAGTRRRAQGRDDAPFLHQVVIRFALAAGVRRIPEARRAGTSLARPLLNGGMMHTRLLSAGLAIVLATGGATLLSGCREKGPAEK